MGEHNRTGFARLQEKPKEGVTESAVDEDPPARIAIPDNRGVFGTVVYQNGQLLRNFWDNNVPCRNNAGN